MAQNWNPFQYGLSPFQDGTSTAGYNMPPSQPVGAPGMPHQQNAHAFAQNAQAPSVNPLANADPAHIAALLQQLQAAGYPMPPLPAAPQPLQQQQLGTPYTPTSQFDGRRTGEDTSAAKAGSEEGEVSGDEDEGTASEYDPAQPAVSHADAHRRDEARRRLSDERRYDRYNNASQRAGAQPWKEPAQSAPSSAQHPVTPRTSLHHPHSPKNLQTQSRPQPVNSGSFPTTNHGQRVLPMNTTVLDPNTNAQAANAPSTKAANTAVANALVEQIVTSLAPTSAAEKSAQTLEEQSKQARKFVSLLSFYGLAYQTVALETAYFTREADLQHLARVYEDLNLPAPPATGKSTPMGQAKSRLLQDAAHTDFSAGVTTAGVPQPRDATATKQPSAPEKVSSKAKALDNTAAKPVAAPKPAETRAAYLAKLKAAKMKVAKPGEGVKSTSASATPPIQTKPPEAQANAPISNDNSSITHPLQADLGQKSTATATAADTQAEADARKKRQTELLQQRLAALKAKQAKIAPTMVPKDAQPASAGAQGLAARSSNGFPGLVTPSLPEVMSATTVAEALAGDDISSPAAQSLNSARKRPVAADFEDFKAMPPRPFKQARSYAEDDPDQFEPMVIDVSDDESDSDDGGIDVEADVADFIRSTADATTQHNPPFGAAQTGQSHVPDFSGQSSVSNNSSSIGTPGTASTPGNAEFNLQLARSELRIAEMKAKIAARQALHRRKMNGSGAETPQKAAAHPESLSVIPASQPPQPHVSESSTTLIQAQYEQQTSHSADIAMTDDSASNTVSQDLPTDVPTSVNGAGMPGLNHTPVEETATQAPVPVAAVESSNDDNDIDSQSDDEELYATTTTGEHERQSSIAPVVDDADFQMSDDEDDSESPPQEAADPIALAVPPKSNGDLVALHTTDSTASPIPQEDRHEGPDVAETGKLEFDAEPMTATQQPPPASAPSSDEDGESVDEDDFYTAEVNVVKQNQASTLEHSDADSPDQSYPISVSEGEIEDQQSSEEEEQQIDSVTQASREIANGTNDDDGDSEDEDSGEDEEPVRNPPDVAVSTTGPTDDRSEQDFDDDDLYEPAPVTEAETAEQSASSSISESLQSSAVDDPWESNASDSESPADHIETTAPHPATAGQEVVIAAIDQPGATNMVVHEGSADQAHYQPYQSPLRAFKDYRYSSQYSSDVQGGYRSMTYSHQIDPNRPVCPYEADGGICNDPDCQGQHFKGMQLSDDMILVQLGTKNPGRDEAEKSKWNNGLRDVLKQLRSTDTRDPDEVARAITAYRRDFLQDPTRVLHM